MISSKRPSQSSPITPAKKRCITDFFPKVGSTEKPNSTPRSNPILDTSAQETPVTPRSEPSNQIKNTPITITRADNLHQDSPVTPRFERSNFTRNTPRSETSNVVRNTPRSEASNVIKNTPKSRPIEKHEGATKNGSAEHLHQTYRFLYPPHRRDIEKRSPDDSDYDEKTLYVPESFLDSQTPALRQWWLIKQRNMDAILFFKMGKFYELFNDDAVVAVNHLDINYMKGDETKPAHAGFPEISYDKYSKILIDKGFKVIRIEQTETPAMMENRCQVTGKKGKFDKVVKREVCRITSKGTQMLGVMESVFHSAQYQYLLVIKETASSKTEQQKTFGVCFVDVTISKIFLGQFLDDHNYSRLHMLLAHCKPVEILYERQSVSKETYHALLRSGAVLSPLRPNKEFWPIKSALAYLRANSIFLNESNQFEWPKFLQELFDGDGSDNLMTFEAKEDCVEGLNAFGALVYYLKSQMIADQVLRCATFDFYNPPGESRKSQDIEGEVMDAPVTSMILDHIALKNLEIFENSEGKPFATLYDSINHCKTHFGQRLLKNWLCSPLGDIKQIENRLDAVQTLISNNNASLMNEISHVLKQTPDLERLLSKVKSQCFKSESDNRAIMFDGDHHSKAKIKTFLNLMQNFKRLRKFVVSVSKTVEVSSSHVLKRLLTLTSDGGLYPEYEETLDYFDAAFDHEMARSSGKIIPAPGVDPDYDRCKNDIQLITQELDDYLEEQKSVLKCKHIEYFGTAKNRFQIQVPEAYCKNVPSDYRIETTRKGVKRYYTSKIDKLFQKLTICEEEMKKTLDGIMSKIFAQFSSKMRYWSSAIECIALLDVLQSIASFVRSLMARNIDICRPEFKSGDPLIKYTDGRHPALVKTNDNFIPNDLELNEKLILLTGANMGGKSTIMRQTALLTILAQIGCFVPASKMVLTPVDRIFSRLGASDRLIEGESTFHTELVETSAMLRYATKNSLLLLDELGRGTSTFDGTAIAYAVAKEITQNINCRCLFSSHYHSLVCDFESDPHVRLAHMGCNIEIKGDYSADVGADPLRESITFLYKITQGPVARSYGFNVAKIAGIDDATITEAFKKSKDLELSSKILHLLQVISDENLNVATDTVALKTKILENLHLANDATVS